MAKERDFRKIDLISNEVSQKMIETFVQNKVSTKEALVITIAAIGKFLQIFSHIADCDRFLLFKIISDGIMRYYNSGGDDRLDAILAATDASVEQDKN